MIIYIPFMATAGGGGCEGLTVWDEYALGSGTVPPDPLPDPPVAAHDELLSFLTVSGEEDFESYAGDGSDRMAQEITSITVNGVTATISSDPVDTPDIGNIDSDTSVGRFNTTPEATGSNYWNYVNSDSSVSAVFTFSEPIAAFWTYITDMGDFSGTVEITFYKTGGGTDVYTPFAPVGGSNGTLNFFGLIDCTGTTYDEVWIRKTRVSDVVGFDGMGWATADQIG